MRVAYHRTDIVPSVDPCKLGTAKFCKRRFFDKCRLVNQIVARFTNNFVLAEVFFVGITCSDRLDRAVTCERYLLLGQRSCQALDLIFLVQKSVLDFGCDVLKRCSDMTHNHLCAVLCCSNDIGGFTCIGFVSHDVADASK